MGARLQLSDAKWAKVQTFLAGDYRVGEPGGDDRNFIEAVLWWRRTGVPWRDLPEEFGPWKTVAFEVTAGHRHDCLSALPVIARVDPNCLLADKAYDSDTIRNELHARDAVARHPAHAFDKELYMARSEVECTFCLLKQARRFATRYEKTLRNYAAVVAIGCPSPPRDTGGPH
jgi:transposase